jgi:tyrosine-protein phosphatase SIW14
VAFSAFVISFAAFANSYPGAEAEIPEFHLVSEGIFRGGRPSEQGLTELAKLGIKTIVNVENVPDIVEAEATLADRLGMKTFSRPMSGFFRPEDENVDNILALIADKKNYPIFVHCQHGQDRTGLLFGLYRVLHEGWTAERAYQEMWDYDFHAYALFPLRDYFMERTSGK